MLIDLSWRIATSVLAKVDFETLIVFLLSDCLDGLDGIGNVGKVDKGTRLFAKSIDEFNLAVLGKVLSQALFGPGFIKIANVDVARSTSTDCKSNCWRQSTRMLAPTNLESAVVNHEALNVAQCIKG